MMIIDNHEKEVKEGDAVFIPSNLEHGIKNIGDTKLIPICIQDDIML